MKNSCKKFPGLYSWLMDMRNVIGRWPSREDLAADLNETPASIRMWFHRNRISAKFDVRLVAAAKKRNIFLTYEELAHARADGSVVKIGAG